MAAARIDMRLDEEIKKKAEKASELLGMKSLTEYLVKLMDEDATRVIAKHKSIMVADDIFDRFIDACKKAQKPNAALIDAVAYTKKQGIK